MRVLVTGASGWLGGRLLAELLQAGHEPRCLVEPSAEAPQPGAGIEAIRGDVRDPAPVAAAVRGVEVVVHCAAVIHPARARDFHSVNAVGTRNVVDAAASAGVRRLLHVSSNAAAGFQRKREVLLNEDDPPRPRGGYGRSKHAAELTVRAAHRSGALETVVLRPCRFYGAGLPPRMQRVFAMVRSGRVPIFGDGLALRSMTSVEDLAELLVQCLDDPAATGETFWVADEAPYTTLATFEAMASAAEVPLRVRRLPVSIARACETLDLGLERLGGYSMGLHLVGESHRDIGCSIEKARRILGFEPRNDITGGFRDALGSRADAALVTAGA